MRLSSTCLSCIMIYLLLRIPSYGQEVVLPLENISTENGLTTSKFNLYISRDSHHYTWISSISGLNRFDGLRNLQFLADDSLENTIKDPIIQSPMFEDAQGDLWFNTSTTIYKYSQERGEFQEVNPTYKGNGFKDFLLIDLAPSTYTLYFLAQKKVLGDFHPLFQMDIRGEEPVLIDSIPYYSFNGLRRIDGPSNASYSLFIPQERGWEIREYNGGQCIGKYPSIQSENSSRNPNTSYYDGEFLWIGTAAGLIKADSRGVTLDIKNRFQDIGSLNVTGIAPFNDSTLIIGTDTEGMFLFDLKKNQFSHKVQVRIDGRIQNFSYRVEGMVLDKESNLWISTESQGVFYINLKKNRFPSSLTGFGSNSPGYNIKSISVMEDGHVWSCTKSNLILENEKGEKIDEIVFSQLVGDTDGNYDVYSIKQDSKGNKWIGTGMGLFLISGNSLTRRNVKRLSGGAFKSVEELSDGRKLALTFGRGLMALTSGETGYKLTENIASTQGQILDICEKFNGQIWISEWRNSLKLLEFASDSFIVKQSIPFLSFVHAIVESPDSAKIWVASDKGLFWIDNYAETPVLHKDYAFSDRFVVANGLVFDDSDRMWVSTNTGIVQYSPELNKEVGGDEPPPNIFRVYTVSDGLPANEFNFWSFTKTKDGRLAFGSTNGYTLFDPEEIVSYSVEAKPTITRVFVQDEEVRGREKYRRIQFEGEEIEELVLEPKERTFTFWFSAMDYGDPQSAQFEYRLRDRNGELINSGKEDFVRYFDLVPGEYILELYAANSENVWNPEPKRIALKLKPYFYETPWFIALLALIGLGAMYGVYRYRINNERKKHRMAELENAILRIQMNPHFIFNSLSSIRAYMLSQDTKVANKYLVHLSKLMRKILDVAEESEISVGEDLELLTEYIEAEKLRFEDSFTYTIERGEGFDEDEYMIPTMILQPFVENAIIHGFKKNAQEGILTLSYRQEGEQLICEVRDNGVGRQTAATQKAKGHTSKATEITQRRLQLIRERTRKPASLEIIDLTGQEGNATGTKVVIRLPIVD